MSLRRAATRVLTSRPSSAFAISSRAFRTFQAPTTKTLASQKSLSLSPRRFLSDSSTQPAETEIATEAATEVAEDALSQEGAEGAAAGPEDAQPEVAAQSEDGSEPPQTEAEAEEVVASEPNVVETSSPRAPHASSSLPADQPPAIQPKSVYVGNLFFEVKENDLKDYFSQVGEVVSARVVTDRRNMSKGQVLHSIHSSRLRCV